MLLLRHLVAEKKLAKKLLRNALLTYTELQKAIVKLDRSRM